MVDDFVKLLQQLVILLFLPDLVGTANALLHLFEGLLEHGCEVLMHLVNVLLQVLNLFLLFCLYFALLSFDLLLFLL